MAQALVLPGGLPQPPYTYRRESHSHTASSGWGRAPLVVGIADADRTTADRRVGINSHVVIDD
jgi:hypothetical protein